MKSILKALLPRHVMSPLLAIYNFNKEHAFVKTTREESSVDKFGRPIPWFTYPAIDYLRQIDFSDMTVYEYGAGNSTFFWCANTRKVVCQESYKNWYNYVRKRQPANCTLSHTQNVEDYINDILSYDRGFDIIVIDGDYRPQCCVNAVEKLNPGGMIILDDSWNHPAGSATLREAGLIEVDMVGLGPVRHTTGVTSLYLHPEFRPKPKFHKQPLTPKTAIMN